MDGLRIDRLTLRLLDTATADANSADEKSEVEQ
jgi:hypothetical protein